MAIQPKSFSYTIRRNKRQKTKKVAKTQTETFRKIKPGRKGIRHPRDATRALTNKQGDSADWGGGRMEARPTRCSAQLVTKFSKADEELAPIDAPPPRKNQTETPGMGVSGCREEAYGASEISI